MQSLGISSWTRATRLVCGLAFSLAILTPSPEHARADDDVQPPPTAEDGNQALADLQTRFKADEKTKSEVRSAEIAAAVAGGGAVTYGVGRAVYQANVAKAAKSARLLQENILRSQRAIQKALQPELERYADAIARLNENRIAAGGERMAANEARDAIMKGLNSPEAKARILQRLRGSLGANAENAFSKVLGPRSESIVANQVEEFYRFNQFRSALRGSEEGVRAFGQANLGENAARALAESVSPSVGRLLFKSAVADIAAESLASRCVGALGLLGRGALRVIGSSEFLVASILLTPSELSSEDTMDAYYAHHPDELLKLPTEEALMWMDNYPRVRAAVVRTRDVVAEMSAGSGDPLTQADVGELLTCPAPPAPEVSCHGDS